MLIRSPARSLLFDSNCDRHNPQINQRGVRRFRDLMDEVVQQEVPFKQHFQTVPLMVDDPDIHAVGHKQPPTGLGEAVALPILPQDAQSLAYRVSSGPLAGLVVQTVWGNGRLGIRLSTASSTLATTFKKERDILEKTLAYALGVDITIEVDHER